LNPTLIDEMPVTKRLNYNKTVFTYHQSFSPLHFPFAAFDLLWGGGGEGFPSDKLRIPDDIKNNKTTTPLPGKLRHQLQ
jgi:hypothetical protein